MKFHRIHRRLSVLLRALFRHSFFLFGLVLCATVIGVFLAHRLVTMRVKAAPPTPPSLLDFPVALSGNTLVEPMVAPPNTTRMTVTTTPDFKGVMSADPATGIIRITNAHPAGTFTMKATYFGNDSSSSTTTFTVTVQTQACNTAATFSSASDVGTGGRASSIAIGDFNRDGIQDFAAVSADTYLISIRLGNGSGGFTGTTNYDLGELLPAIAIGDFNGDGKQDLVVTRYQSSEVSVLLGDGVGGFTNGSSVNVGERPIALTTGDFNGDGKLDIAVINQLARTVNVRFGDGLGGLSGTTSFSFSIFPQDIKASDFNRDGKTDLAIAGNGSGGNILIRLGDGAGGFTNAPNVLVGLNSGALAIGDFNGDGNPDLAAANFDSGIEGVPKYVAIRLGTGTGSFTNAPNITLPLNRTPASVAVADFNGDDKQDIAIGNGGFNGVYAMIRRGNGDGSFADAPNVGLDAARSPDALVVGDFTGDGAQDFAVGSRTASGIQIRLAPTCVPPNTTPTITPSSLSALQGDQINVVPITIASVNDNETPAGDLSVSVIPGGTATGITIDSLTNNGGEVKAFVLVACDATAGTVILQVTDGELSATADYQVFLSPNAPPQLGNYPATSVSAGGSTIVTPDAAPFDSGSAPTLSVSASACFAGTLLVDATGAVTVNNPVPSGSYTITVRATDNCGASVCQSFVLTVTGGNSCGITINPGTLPTPTKGKPYAQTLSASPTGSYSFSLAAGALPPGMQLVNVLGIYSLRGTPTTAGTYNFALKAKKNNSTCEAFRCYQMTIP